MKLKKVTRLDESQTFKSAGDMCKAMLKDLQTMYDRTEKEDGEMIRKLIRFMLNKYKNASVKGTR